ncbi:HEPN domain-containing protein [Thermococcus sp. SY098]|uniref:HEPN domain-containing protein n=1 Tax=Thermococcus sp. SY098 TaxID=3111325 RepID=UPI002D77B220|nr:HEPN domain-containing protein [Thermococcus sp. SY098]WRS53231.1 HEPN domain-containing protein [Thermococcus sp. SY098]
MDEIEKHLVAAEESLNEAKILLEKGLYRGTVSRAYYSMFHSAKALLLTKNLSPRKHSGIVRVLGLEFVSKGYLEEVYAKAFKYAFDMRQKADYGVEFVISKEVAEELVENAELFLERVKRAVEELRK